MCFCVLGVDTKELGSLGGPKDGGKWGVALGSAWPLGMGAESKRGAQWACSRAGDEASGLDFKEWRERRRSIVGLFASRSSGVGGLNLCDALQTEAGR